MIIELNTMTGFTSGYTECENILYSGCCSQSSHLNTRPWAYQFSHGNSDNLCEPLLQQRTEKGWTLDFVFNREGLDWNQDNIFYYFGVRGEYNEPEYADNNLTFGFTDDGKVFWEAIRYSGTCINNNYNENFFIERGETPILCANAITEDFNITITFERNLTLNGCDLSNTGGWNDLISGNTITNAMGVILSGETPNYEYNIVLNEKWESERKFRLGTLKIYLNGNPIYKLKDWEEVILSDRGHQPFIQQWGGPVVLNNLYNTEKEFLFNLKHVSYFEEPLNYIHIKHHYKTTIVNNYNINECNIDCEDNISGADLFINDENELIIMSDGDTINIHI